jgi:hypothetical protein
MRVVGCRLKPVGTVSKSRHRRLSLDRLSMAEGVTMIARRQSRRAGAKNDRKSKSHLHSREHFRSPVWIDRQLMD